MPRGAGGYFGLDWIGLDQTGFTKPDCIGQDWTGLDRDDETGLDWRGLDSNGLDCIGLCGMVLD